MTNVVKEGTRHKTIKIEHVPPPWQPRLGRRESEPHSHEITYLYDALTHNYPNYRIIWDLHHYFSFQGERLDIQFDISFFMDLDIPITYDLSSYNAEKYGNKVPTLAINILSNSTYGKDLRETMNFVQAL